MSTSTWIWSVTALLFGLNIGSFLNVVIWRIPRGGSLIKPEHSYCPNCERRLTVVDLVPLFSFLLLGRRCRTCKQPISWRYFCVELLTGLLFMALAIRFQHSPADAVSLMLFTALLVPMTFIDLEFYAIPEQLNLLAFAVAIGRDIWGIALHEPNHALLFGWLPRSVVGALVGTSIFGGVRLAGWIWKRREAMGLGDVLLARAMGAMLVMLVPAGLPLLRLFPAWALLSCVCGMVVGIPMLMIGGRSQEQPDEKIAPSKPAKQGKHRGAVEIADEEPDQEPSTLKEQLQDIGYVLILGDLFHYIQSKLPLHRRAPDGHGAEPAIADEEFTPDPTAIPFGPFLAIGFLATVFVGEALTAWYLAVAFPKPN